MKTNLASVQPWGLIIRKGTRLLCADGVVRSVSRISSTADTFFSVPAAIRIRGVNITGYATSDETKRAPFARVYTFRQHTDQKEKCIKVGLPDWPIHRYSPEMETLLEKGA